MSCATPMLWAMRSGRSWRGRRGQSHGSDWSWMNSRSSRRTASHRWANVPVGLSGFSNAATVYRPMPCSMRCRFHRTDRPSSFTRTKTNSRPCPTVRGFITHRSSSRISISIFSSVTTILAISFWCQLSCWHRQGRLRSQLFGAERHDLVLRLIEQLDPAQIHHVPRVLYHCNAVRGASDLDVSEGDCAQSNSIRAVGAFFQRNGIAATAEPHADVLGRAHPTAVRTRWALPDPPPMVSIIIPTRDRKELLGPCIELAGFRAAWVSRANRDHYRRQ